MVQLMLNQTHQRTCSIKLEVTNKYDLIFVMCEYIFLSDQLLFITNQRVSEMEVKFAKHILYFYV